MEKEEKFQSTHPHGVRLLCAPPTGREIKFQSTHPHGVRLLSDSYRRLNSVVSIHAPTRGATVIFRFVNPFDRFQSTHPHGVRRRLLTEISKFRLVSIHAPTRGATCAESASWSLLACFNPRAHTGCDGAEGVVTGLGCGFNPRTHTGCDLGATDCIEA